MCCRPASSSKLAGFVVQVRHILQSRPVSWCHTKIVNIGLSRKAQPPLHGKSHGERCDAEGRLLHPRSHAHVDSAVTTLSRPERPQQRRLGLKDNQLEELPEAIGGLTALVELFITNNKLRALPASFASLTSLVKLQVPL